MPWRHVAFRTLALSVFAGTIASAQAILNDSKRIADAQHLFDTLQDSHTGGEVLAIQPHFLFSLRMQAGYITQPPASPFQDRGRQWIILTRITPKEGAARPVYLSQVVQVPIGEAPPVDGFYWLGRGLYHAELLMFNGRGDVCRKTWEIDARLDPGVGKIKPALPDGQVAGFFDTGQISASEAGSIGRVTILLHAASNLQLQTMLGPLDKSMLLDGVTGLLAELPAKPVRLVVFSLEQQKELLRKEGFKLQALPEVMQALDAVEPASVDYSALQNSSGPGDFVEKLLQREIKASAPSGAVIFLGPRSAYKDKPPARLTVSPESKQRFYYLLCDPTRFLLPRSSTLDGNGWGPQGFAMGFSSPRLGGAGRPNVPYDHVWKNYGPNAGADTIEYAVDQLKGKTVQVDSASSFAAAVDEIIRLSGKSR